MIFQVLATLVPVSLYGMCKSMGIVVDWAGCTTVLVSSKWEEMLLVKSVRTALSSSSFPSLTRFVHPVDNVHAYEPRGWSVLHGIEGWQNMCRGMIITNNQIGPAGHAPNTGFQFKKRDSTGNYGAGQWADGISIACFQSTVSNNVRPSLHCHCSLVA